MLPAPKIAFETASPAWQPTENGSRPAIALIPREVMSSDSTRLSSRWAALCAAGRSRRWSKCAFSELSRGAEPLVGKSCARNAESSHVSLISVRACVPYLEAKVVAIDWAPSVRKS